MALASLLATLLALLPHRKGERRVRKVISTFRSMRSELIAGIDEMRRQRIDNAYAIQQLISNNNEISSSIEDAEAVHAALGMFVPEPTEGS